jgi:hypothetical protein
VIFTKKKKKKTMEAGEIFRCGDDDVYMGYAYIVVTISLRTEDVGSSKRLLVPQRHTAL